ncbi:hypothetical protein B0H14DRAFT_3158834 [Mycena olivaceomarginata]|nr:hypothetical protein B0H14DRAFT_3158834 [Mycena olivaceomarginata]
MRSWHGSREKRRFPTKKSTGSIMMQTMWTNARSSRSWKRPQILSAAWHALKLLAKLKRLTGVLQTANMLDLEELVNMAEEQRAGEQDREVNGGDDDNYVDKDPCPTRDEVLRASAILRRYVGESGDTFARQMETILGRFSRQTCLEQHDLPGYYILTALYLARRLLTASSSTTNSYIVKYIPQLWR